MTRSEQPMTFSRLIRKAVFVCWLLHALSSAAQTVKLFAAAEERWDDRFDTLGLNGPVYAIAVRGQDVYAGGYFTKAGEVSANNIARWDGSTWHALGNGISSSGTPAIVYALALAADGKLYAAGQFATAGNGNANNIAVWNGSDWARLGSGGARGTNSTVYALAAKENEIFAGGIFTMAGDIVVNGVAKWNGVQWSRLGATSANGVTGGGVYALSIYGELLIAGGDFANAGAVASVNNIAQWHITTGTWAALAQGINGKVQSLSGIFFGDLVAGGIFSSAIGVRANNVAKWNGNAWASLGTGAANGVTGEVRALAAGAGYLYVGGNFFEAGGAPIRSIARRDRNSWSTLSSGVDGAVHALAYDSSGAVLVGGQFSNAGGKPSKNFGIWHEATNAVAERNSKNEIRNFELYQNYPNPFNPSTTIHYYLLRAQFVHLQIFATNGQEVRTLVQGRQMAGEHRLRFHASNLSAGVYWYRLAAGDFEQTRKMLLLR